MARRAQNKEDFSDEEKPMDEFQWEKFLKESDAVTERYMKALEKYAENPDQEKLAAEEMGWTWVAEFLEGHKKQAEAAVPEPEPEESAGPDLPQDPNPMTEGVDWIRTEDGRITHPLALQTMRLAMDMWHTCQDRRLLGGNEDPDLREMIFQTQITSAKLAGALNSLAYDREHDDGFIVACLKRALAYLHRALAATEKTGIKPGLLSLEKTAHYRATLFHVREEILRLMKRFRGR